MAAADLEAELAGDLKGFQHDPLGYVLYAFPWGEPGTPLANVSGPRSWQRDQLERVGKALRDGADRIEALREAQAELEAIDVRESAASGHGIGKSAQVSFLVLWALSTMADTRCTVTANTSTQLATKTWPELKKWHRLAINGHWFEWTATSLHSVDPHHERTWRADAIPWSKDNSEAFAGLHNQGRRVLLIFDEASAIADEIWDVAEGALTDADTELLWFAFGNPTRNSGKFRETFGRSAHRWEHRQIDSRTVEGTNKAQLAKWVADYGEDSDFVRVRVKGEFPRSAATQFIGSDIVAEAATREAVCHLSDPVIMAIDVARSNDGDETSIGVRRGFDARTVPPINLRSTDLMYIVGRATSEVDRLANMGWHVAMVFVDMTGVGAGVCDRLKQLLGAHRVIGVNFGGQADSPVPDGEACANKASEMWAKMRAWARDGGAIEDDPELKQQMEGREFGYDHLNRIVIEKKDDMKDRGLASPDRADRLALTFAYPVRVHGESMKPKRAIGTDYHPYEQDR